MGTMAISMESGEQTEAILLTPNIFFLSQEIPPFVCLFLNRFEKGNSKGLFIFPG